MKRKTKRTKIGTIFDVLKLNFKFVSVKDKTELIFDPRGKHGPRLEQFLNSSCPRNIEQFGNGGKKCAHILEVPITFLELF